eukprot:1338061-Prymnesium_polylepis.1
MRALKGAEFEVVRACAFLGERARCERLVVAGASAGSSERCGHSNRRGTSSACCRIPHTGKR